ncbi:site-specific DNA-methyltransferase [Candidatus Woesearchaeota archaeon]|nr:site-specific DNA-methyltransferase [Candidatus Woesearchaeota archaeon]
MANGKRNYIEWSKEELIREILALKKQKTYGLVWEREKTKEDFDLFINWEGEKTKEEFSLESKDKFPVLAEVKDKEINTDKDKPVNLLIEGDNYHSLTVLNFTHKNSVDVIYIDPPYNTGNKDFKYNDKFVDKEDGYRHSKWLSFMSKRLALAKNLLKDTGVIFISIDDNEVAQLKLLCDDVFGETNFIGNLIWRKKEGGGQADDYFAREHEYILVYSKSNKFKWRDEIVPVKEAEYNKEDKDGKFTAVKLAKWGNTARKEDREKMHFPIKSPDGKNVIPYAPDGNLGRWRVGKKRMDELINKNLIYWQKKEDKWIPYEKIYFTEGDVKKIKERSILYELATTADGTNELKEIFSVKDVFQNPKPTELIKFFLKFGADDNAVILDFFAGSGTTGHSVLKLNSEDGGKRKFIICTNNEDNNGDGRKICTDICYPRIKKNIDEHGGNLKYYKTDFVEAEQTDKNKRKLVDNCTEMLCIKENTFEKVKDAKKFKIFKNDELHLGIIFDDEYIDEFVKEAEKINGKIHVYVFSHDDSVPTKEFKTIKNKVTLCPIPETILKVYRKVFKND